MTEIERVIAAKALGERICALAVEAPGVHEDEIASIAVMAGVGAAVSFAATRNMDARAIVAEIAILAQSMAADVADRP